MLDTLRLFCDHMQYKSFPEHQAPQVDTAVVGSSVRLFHSLEHDGAIIAGHVSHQAYTVLVATLVRGVSPRKVEFEVIV